MSGSGGCDVDDGFGKKKVFYLLFSFTFSFLIAFPSLTNIDEGKKTLMGSILQDFLYTW